MPTLAEIEATARTYADARDSLAFLERTNEVVIRADERAKVLAEVRAMLDRAGGAT